MDLHLGDTVNYYLSYSLIFFFCIIGLLFSWANYSKVARIKLAVSQAGDSYSTVNEEARQGDLEEGEDIDAGIMLEQSEDFKIYSVAKKIHDGAQTYMQTEFLYFLPILLFCDSLLILAVGLKSNFKDGLVCGFLFSIGIFFSMWFGWVGMNIATMANARTTKSARKSLQAAFLTSFYAAQSYSVFMYSVAILVTVLIHYLMSFIYSDPRKLCEKLTCWALGCSMGGFTLRGSGGIFTKAADIAADLVGKLENKINEDDARNPASIADNVGDNVGDIAGMTADLNGSFSEATCAFFLLVSNASAFQNTRSYILFAPLIYACSIPVAILTSYSPTWFNRPERKDQIESSLKFEIVLFSSLMVLVSLIVCLVFLPPSFNVARDDRTPIMTTNIKCFMCILAGFIGSSIIEFSTEYYTSNNFRPVQQLAESSETGPASVIINGMALGSFSTVLPCITIAALIYVGYFFASYFGVVLTAISAICRLPLVLKHDTIGPIVDNAGGIAEMAGCSEEVRERTDALDAAGNTTAAIGKGYAIALASLVGTALFVSFVEQNSLYTLAAAEPLFMGGMIVGTCMVYYFTAVLNSSVMIVATKMVKEVRRQFMDHRILSGEIEPDHRACIKIATMASIFYMIKPILIPIIPIFVGFFFGLKLLAGLMLGVICCGISIAIMLNNSGGAWDNAKKYIEAGNLGPNKGKNSENHYAAVIGDTVGDPFKDTSGPTVNTLIKIVVIGSLAFSSVYPREGILERWLT